MNVIAKRVIVNIFENSVNIMAIQRSNINKLNIYNIKDSETNCSILISYIFQKWR